MKKSSIIAINLKSVRIPLILCTFFSVILFCISLSKILPPFTPGEDFLNMILSSNISFHSSSAPLFSVYASRQYEKPEPVKSPAPVPAEAKTLSVKEISSPSGIEINNQTDLSVDSAAFLSPLPEFLKEDISVLIVHTHTTESYTPSDKYRYTPTDTDRTTDKNFNMVRVGREIEKVLSSHGIKVLHDTTINDYPSYSGSYNRSAKNIENQLKNDSSFKIVLDVHRDAIEGKNGEKIKHSTEIEGKSVSKIMFVAGSDQSGLSHDNWKENMRFAVQLQQHILSMYPDLCRPINFRSQRFNQQLAPGAVIVELGTNGNTLDEAILGARYFAEGLADFIGKSKEV